MAESALERENIGCSHSISPQTIASIVGRSPGTDVSIIDRVGTFLSGLCAVHCFLIPLVLPLIFSFAPTLAHTVEDLHRFEIYFVLGTLALATISFWKTSLRYVVVTPWICLALSALAFTAAGIVASNLHPWMMGIGGTFLAFGHAMNIKIAHRSCTLPCCGHPENCSQS